MKRSLLFLTIVLSAFTASAAERLTGLRSHEEADRSRVVFDLTGKVKYQLFTLTGPDRLVIDIENTERAEQLPLPRFGKMVQSIRVARREQNDLRVVLDLAHEVKPKSFLLPPQHPNGHRLVLDLQSASNTEATRLKVAEPAARPVIVVIDPGHGGVDPGALGKNGLREKDVVLAISRELANLVNQQPGMKALLTRDDDRFIELSKRRLFAHKQQADLFVSIHANSFRSSKVKGSAVYALSENGASSAAAKALADKENAADLLGGVDLADKDDLVKSVLLDLSQNATQQSSLQLAKKILGGLGAVNKVHRQDVQTAGFVVLKSPSVPSVLIETAFISNPSEERLLGSDEGQRKIARAIFRGMNSFVASDMGLRLASVRSERATINTRKPIQLAVQQQSRIHQVQYGDTLSELANQYGVSLSRLRAANNIAGDRLLIGKKLQIPAVGGT